MEEYSGSKRRPSHRPSNPNNNNYIEMIYFCRDYLQLVGIVEDKRDSTRVFGWNWLHKLSSLVYSCWKPPKEAPPFDFLAVDSTQPERSRRRGCCGCASPFSGQVELCSTPSVFPISMFWLAFADLTLVVGSPEKTSLVVSKGLP